MKVFIDGISVTNKTLSLLKPVITWRKKDETGNKAFSFSSDISFYGTDYDYIKSKLWDNLDANSNNVSLQTEVKLRFEDECCDSFPVEFRISAESIKWCEGSCEVTVNAIESSPEEESLRCVQNTLIADNTPTNWTDNVPFKSRRHPRFVYCNEMRPRFIHKTLILFSTLLASIISIFQIVINLLGSVISGINNFITSVNNFIGTNFNQIGGGTNAANQKLSEISASLNALLSDIIGCGRKHPSPLMREYVQNVCGKCGLSFSSSILNDTSSDYFNACYVYARVDKGVNPLDNSTFWVSANEPIRTGEQFLNELGSLFNAKWGIKGSVLSFERKDSKINSTPFVNTNDLDSNKFSVCYSWSRKTRPAFGTFEYQNDAVNTVGIEVIRRWGDVVEWNNPPLINQKGEFKPLMNFAAARFRNDNLRLSDGPDQDVYKVFENSGFIGTIIKQFDKALLLNEHKCLIPMALIWDGIDKVSATVDPNQFIPAANDPNFPAFANNVKATPPGEYYNYPFWFDANMPNNMYDRFWAIENPRTSGFQGKSYTLILEMTCELIQNCDLDGTIQLSEGIGHVDQIEFNYANKTITITGEI